MGSFSGKVILITGATSGIGWALAVEMAAPGVTLLLAARREMELASVQQECNTKGATTIVFIVDMATSETVAVFANKVLQHYPVIDILINNAGISQRALAEETEIKIDRRILEVNFFGPVQLTKALWPALINSKHANIVLISSVTGSFGFPLRSAYAASKHAIEGFFESWMLENKKRNIVFTIVAPGRIRTNISSAALTGDGKPHRQSDPGLESGISAEDCARKIIRGIHLDKRKIYVARQELVLVILRKCFPFLFFRLARRISPV